MLIDKNLDEGSQVTFFLDFNFPTFYENKYLEKERKKIFTSRSSMTKEQKLFSSSMKVVTFDRKKETQHP